MRTLDHRAWKEMRCVGWSRSHGVCFAGLLLTACGSPRDESAATAKVDATMVDTTAVVDSHASGRAASGVGEAPVWEAEDCGFAERQGHPDPGPLIDEYLERDAQRAAVAVDEWFEGAVLCPDHEGGPDMYGLASGYTTRHLPSTDTTAAAIVTTRRLGYVEFPGGGGSQLVIDTAITMDTVRAVRTPFGWRIDGPAFRLAVHPGSPLARSHLSADDRARLAPLLAPQ
jgi:hypothetical protein